MKIEFTTNNAAFCDPITQEPSKEYRAIETALILKRIAYAVEQGCTNGTVMDINGNAVGSWDINM